MFKSITALEPGDSVVIDDTGNCAIYSRHVYDYQNDEITVHYVDGTVSHHIPYMTDIVEVVDTLTGSLGYSHR